MGLERKLEVTFGQNRFVLDIGMIIVIVQAEEVEVTFRQESQLTPSCRDIFVPKYLEEKMLKIYHVTLPTNKNVSILDFLSELSLFARDEIDSNRPRSHRYDKD